MKTFRRCLLTLGLCALGNAWGDTGEQTLQAFKHAPFPLNNKQASSFFNVIEPDRRGRDSQRSGLLWEDTVYSDNRVLMAIGPNFSARKHPVLVVYLHGNQAILERDVLERQQIPAQVAAANINAFLLAPQFAVDALDSSPGNFSQRNYFAAFIDEAASHASRWQNNKHLNDQLKHAPMIIVAYSGGYLAAANILNIGGVSDRVIGVILLDGLYGDEEIFAKWLSRYRSQSFFFSAYTEPAKPSNDLLQSMLKKRGLAFKTDMPSKLHPRAIHFVTLDKDVVHQDLLTRAWIDNPLTDLLKKINLSKSVKGNHDSH